MELVGLGDLSRLLQQQSQYTQLRRSLETSGQELATGRKADLNTTFAGDFSPLAGIESSLTRLRSYEVAGKEAETMASVMQNALDTIVTITTTSGTGIAIASQGNGATFVNAGSQDAEQALESIIAALNTQVGERSIFAGQQTDQPAIASIDTLLTDVTAAVSGQTTASGVLATIDAWFDIGGGFDTQGYLGGPALAEIPVGQGVSVDLGVTAADERIRALLASFVAGTIVNDAAIGLSSSEQVDLLSSVGLRLASGSSDVVDVQADIGAKQAQIEYATLSRESEISALELSRAELVAADPFEAATRFEAAQSQLEAFYTVTARLSSLSLVNFIR